MLAFTALSFSFLFSAVLGFPLAQRDVVSPHITNPRQGTIWVVGSQEQVTWETDNLPPDSQITNPNGRVILGFQANNSLNLQLDHPLAENFKLRAGQVTITVPDVPPREDYIIVLMGDSGNASPAFAITSIQRGNSSSASGTSTTNGSSSRISTSSDNSPPITGNTITGGASTSAPASSTTLSASASASSILVPSAPGPVSLASSFSVLQSTSTASSSSATVAASAAAASTSTNAAWSVHSYEVWSVLAAPLALSLFI